MQKISREERRKALRDRTYENFQNRDSGAGKRVLDFSSADPKPTFFQPKDGEFYTLDIIPYIVKTNNHPQKKKLGYEDYLLDIWVHRFVGPGQDNLLCLAKTFGKPCPICEEREMLRKSGGDEAEIEALAPKRRVIYNVIDLGSRDQKIQLWEISYYLFEKPLIAAAQIGKDQIVIFSDLEEGKTIKFTAHKKSMGSTSFVEPTGIGFIDRQPYDEAILDEAYSLDEFLVIPTYDEVKNSFYGTEESAENTPPAEESNEPSSARRRRDPVEESASVPSPSRREERQQKKEQKNKCPHGHIFGTDCDEKTDCSDCEIWELCVDEQDKMME